jgi:hypothetical protein
MMTFWQFAHERQSIWHRRFVQQLPKPWTSDPMLKRYHFTNVHRELDIGTQVMQTYVIDQHQDELLITLIFNVMLYRIFNRADMWQACDPFVYHYDELDLTFKKIRDYRDIGNKIATKAWTVPPLVHIDGVTWLDRVETAVRSWDITRISSGIERSRTLIDADIALTGTAAIGSFIRLQVLLDLTSMLKFNDDEPLPHLYSSKGKHRNGKSYLKPQGSAEGELLIGYSVQELRDRQTEMLTRENLDWSQIAWDRKPRLTMADIEHTLCEYVKYVTVHDDSNRKWMRRYDG